MDNANNQQIVEQLYKYFGEGNMQAAIPFFDNDITWVRPGEPEIPFAGTFKGIEGIIKMLSIQSATLEVKTFLPKKICADDNMVVVLGMDMVVVRSTGKTYTSEWVHAFTFKNGKITYVRVYMDTKKIADAFLP
jgi:ketosteroid isomerase-like protein